MNNTTRIVKEIGGHTCTARLCGLSAPAVHGWCKRDSIPAAHCPTIENYFERTLRCEQMRPDVMWRRDDAGRVLAYIVPVRQS